MSDEIKNVDEALEVLKGVSEAKKNKTTRSDKELAEEVAKAMKVIEEAGIETPKKVEETREPLFKSRYGYTGAKSDGVMAYKKAISKTAGEGDVWLKKFQRWNDDVLLASIACEKTPTEILKNVPEFGEFFDGELAKDSGDLAKALASVSTGSGEEWIPELFSPELIDLIRVERVLMNSFRRFPMSAPTVNLNQLTNEFASFGIAESTTNDPYSVPAIISDLGTGRVILIAVELAVASIFSRTFEEDSIVPALPEIRRRMAEGMAKGIENAIINGSTFATHPDSDVAATAGGVSDVQALWKGLRAEAMGDDMTDLSATVDLSAANMTASNVLQLKLLQGRFGAVDSDSMWITSPQGLVKLLGLQDSAGQQVLLTIDRFGQRAVLNSGSVASLFGADVVVSDLVKADLDANGVRPATPEDRTLLIRAHKPAFLIGDRRNLSVEMDSAPLTRQRIMVATERMIFQRVKPSQSVLDRPVTIGRNIEAA